MSVVSPQWSLSHNPTSYPVSGYGNYYAHPAHQTYGKSPIPFTTVTHSSEPSSGFSNSPSQNSDAELIRLLSAMSGQKGRKIKKKDDDHDDHDHNKADSDKNPALKIAKHLAIAGGMFLFGMLLNNPLMKPRNPFGFKLISPDWKDWAKIIAGIVTVNQVNKAFDWKPAPFVSAVESVAVINALSVGFTKGSFIQMLFLAPIVGAVVQAASFLNDNIADPLKEKFGIPTLVTKLAISAGTIILGLKAYPQALWLMSKMGFMGKNAQIMAIKHSLSGLMGKAAQQNALSLAKTGKYGKELRTMAQTLLKGGTPAKKLEQNLAHNVGKLVLTAEGTICSRGCCNFLLCLSEIGEMVSAYLNKGQSKSQRERSQAR